jgi:hypothetical protein
MIADHDNGNRANTGGSGWEKIRIVIVLDKLIETRRGQTTRNRSKTRKSLFRKTLV